MSIQSRLMSDVFNLSLSSAEKLVKQQENDCQPLRNQFNSGGMDLVTSKRLDEMFSNSRSLVATGQQLAAKRTAELGITAKAALEKKIDD